MTALLIQSWKTFDTVSQQATAPLHDEAQYAHALELLEDLWAQADDPAIRRLIDLLSARVEEYETRQCPPPQTTPAELLAFLLEQHGLRQKDLADIAPQSVISEILSGKRGCSVAVARKLGLRFGVRPEHFL